MAQTARDYAAMSEQELIPLARQRDPAAIRTIMQRCNQHLFRLARSVLRDDAEAEDVLQETYLRAFSKLDTFRGDSALLTWLTRIALNEARGRLRRRKPNLPLEALTAHAPEEARVLMFPSVTALPDPESSAARTQIRQLIERGIDTLPEPFRLVFILRDVEECSIEETAEQLGIRAETVKTRLHRARRLMRAALDQELAASTRESFPFLGARCERLTNAVLERLQTAKV